MKRIIALALLATTWLLANTQTVKNTDDSNKTKKMQKQENIIAAKELCDAFVKDKAQAEKDYSKKVMTITGVAIFVGPDIFGLPSIELSEKKNGKSYALCVLPLTDYLKLLTVSKGDEVVMKGEVRSIYDKGQTVVVKECKIMEVIKSK